MKTDIRMRPMVTISSDDPDAVVNQLQRQVARDDSLFELLVLSEYQSVLRLRETELWTPQASLTIRDDRAGGTELYCRFEPSWNVWSAFMAGYAIAGFGGFIAMCWGFGQLLAGNDPWALWIMAICLLLITNIYTFSLFGRALGYKEVHDLLAQVEMAAANVQEPEE